MVIPPEVVVPPEVVIPPSCATGGGLPPAVRHPQKKHVLEFWSMYLVDLFSIVVDFCRFWGPQSGTGTE